DVALEFHDPSRALGHVDRCGAEHPREVAEAVCAALFERGSALREDVLHGGDVAAHLFVAGPRAAQLGDLLLQRHLGQQRPCPLKWGRRRVMPWLFGHHSPRRGAVESRTTRLVASSTWCESRDSPAARRSRVRSATRPMSNSGCWTTVSAGVASVARMVSSKPTTLRSSGTRNPRRRAASTTPSAVVSLAANTALGGSSSSSSWVPISRPAG